MKNQPALQFLEVLVVDDTLVAKIRKLPYLISQAGSWAKHWVRGADSEAWIPIGPTGTQVATAAAHRRRFFFDGS
jgi:hypothetical protein